MYIGTPCFILGLVLFAMVLESSVSSSSTVGLDPFFLSSFIHHPLHHDSSPVDIDDHESSISSSFSNLSRHRELLASSVVEVLECQDATQWYNWERRYGGINLLDKHYDCGCVGDIDTVFKMTCRLENHCYVQELLLNSTTTDMLEEFNNNNNDTTTTTNDTTAETTNENQTICLNHQLEMDFEVNITEDLPLLYLNRQRTCIDFIKGGGPPMPHNELCIESTPLCIAALRDPPYDYHTEQAVTICNDQTVCPMFLQENLTFSPQQAADYCPMTTLGGEVCNTSPNSELSSLCGDEDEWDTDNFVYLNTADCSNIAPCARGACFLTPRINATLDSVIPPYPDCMGTLPPQMENETSADEDDDEASGGNSSICGSGKWLRILIVGVALSSIF